MWYSVTPEPIAKQQAKRAWTSRDSNAHVRPLLGILTDDGPFVGFPMRESRGVSHWKGVWFKLIYSPIEWDVYDRLCFQEIRWTWPSLWLQQHQSQVKSALQGKGPHGCGWSLRKASPRLGSFRICVQVSHVQCSVLFFHGQRLNPRWWIDFCGQFLWSWRVHGSRDRWWRIGGAGDGGVYVLYGCTNYARCDFKILLTSPDRLRHSKTYRIRILLLWASSSQQRNIRLLLSGWRGNSTWLMPQKLEGNQLLSSCHVIGCQAWNCSCSAVGLIQTVSPHLWCHYHRDVSTEWFSPLSSCKLSSVALDTGLCSRQQNGTCWSCIQITWI